ncbi:MAG: amino acid ABC transporter substrate-binding protein [Rhodocyclaceae bacterium]|nr:amino acid ABC transporter substrate-binding protein [Rhodocyclaceae bacterium]
MRPLTLAHRIRSRQCLAALALLLSCTGAWAQAGTLDKIKKSGIIALGHREASIPFSYLGDNRQPVGYSVELCQRVAESVKRQLGLAQLNIKWVQVVPENRMEKLISGEIDLECGSTTNTLSRQEQVAFSLLTFADGGSLMMKHGSTLKGLADMGGRTIGVVPGTTTERTLRDALSRHKVKAKTVLLRDHADGVVAVMQGKVDAYASDRVILFGLVLGSGNQKNLRLTEELFFLRALCADDAQGRPGLPPGGGPRTGAPLPQRGNLRDLRSLARCLRHARPAPEEPVLPQRPAGIAAVTPAPRNAQSPIRCSTTSRRAGALRCSYR